MCGGTKNYYTRLLVKVNLIKCKSMFAKLTNLLTLLSLLESDNFKPVVKVVLGRIKIYAFYLTATIAIKKKCRNIKCQKGLLFMCLAKHKMDYYNILLRRK